MITLVQTLETPGREQPSGNYPTFNLCDDSEFAPFAAAVEAVNGRFGYHRVIETHDLGEWRDAVVDVHIEEALAILDVTPALWGGAILPEQQWEYDVLMTEGYNPHTPCPGIGEGELKDEREIWVKHLAAIGEAIIR